MPARVWTKKMCADVACQYKTRSQFHDGNRAAYQAAWKAGWIEDVCAHMPRMARPHFRWPKKKIVQLAAQCSTYSEFMQKHMPAYRIAHMYGWLDEVTAHLARAKTPNGYWTKERCAERAVLYQTRSEFIRENPAAADAAYRLGFMDEICAHMIVRGHRHSRAIYVIRRTGSRQVYIGLGHDPYGRYAAHTRAPLTPAVASIVAAPHTFKIIYGFMPTKQAAKIEAALIERFQRAGWNVANRRRGGETGSGKRRWTDERLQEVADRCATRGEMLRRFSKAYHTAHKYNLIDKLFAGHANRGFREDIARDYTFDELKDAASPYATRLAFRNANDKAWQAAHRRNLLGVLFSDKPNQGLALSNWTDADIREAAKTCRTSGEFFKTHKNAYRAAQRRGLLRVLFPESNRH